MGTAAMINMFSSQLSKANRSKRKRCSAPVARIPVKRASVRRHSDDNLVFLRSSSRIAQKTMAGRNRSKGKTMNTIICESKSFYRDIIIGDENGTFILPFYPDSARWQRPATGSSQSSRSRCSSAVERSIALRLLTEMAAVLMTVASSAATMAEWSEHVFNRKICDCRPRDRS